MLKPLSVYDFYFESFFEHTPTLTHSANHKPQPDVVGGGGVKVFEGNQGGGKLKATGSGVKRTPIAVSKSRWQPWPTGTNVSAQVPT